MFCSTCGKTIHVSDEICPHCGAKIGESRFGGTPYTSAQAVIAPNQTSFEPMRNYTRTTYTRKGDEAEENAEVDSRTTYRPVYEGDQSPRDLGLEKKDGPKIGDVVEDDDSVANFIPGVPLSKTAQETLDELEEELKPDEQIDRSRFVSRPIQSAGRAGISRDVSEYIRHLEDQQARKAANSRRRRRADEDAYLSPEGEDEYTPQTDEEYPNGEEGYAEDYGDGEYADENYEEGDTGDGGYEDGYDDYAGDDGYDQGRRMPLRVGQIVRIVAALAVVAALVFGVTTWIRYVRGNSPSSTIEGVTETLYEQGLELVRSHTEQAYIDDLVATYASDGMLSTSAKLQQATDAINALMPAEPAENDATFIQALQKIEQNISNAVIMDGINSSGQGISEDAQAESDANWKLVNDSVATLQAATSVSDLNSILSGQTITVRSNTPEPTATAQIYNTLSKGDENNDVMKLQVRLYNLGYLTGDRDGVYGSKTANAVAMFQERVGITINGNVADNETQTRLYADDAPYAEGATTPTPSVTQSPTPEPTEELIQPAEAQGTVV